MRSWMLVAGIGLSIMLPSCGKESGASSSSVGRGEQSHAKNLEVETARALLEDTYFKACNRADAFADHIEGSFQLSTGGDVDMPVVRKWVAANIASQAGASCTSTGTREVYTDADTYICNVPRKEGMHTYFGEYQLPGHGFGAKLNGCLYATKIVIIDRTVDSQNPKLVNVIFKKMPKAMAVASWFPPLQYGYANVIDLDMDAQHQAVFRRLDATGWQLESAR